MSDQLTTCATLRRIEAAHAHQGLMEAAGQAAADLAMRLQTDKTNPVLILAGPGNNGGDAFVVARHLHTQGYRVFLAFSGDPDRLPANAAQAWKMLRSTGLGWQKSLADLPTSIRWGLIIDGLFGIGLTRARKAFTPTRSPRPMPGNNAITARCWRSIAPPASMPIPVAAPVPASAPRTRSPSSEANPAC